MGRSVSRAGRSPVTESPHRRATEEEHKNSMNSVTDKGLSSSALVSLLAAGGQDFEFYPTTDEIISALIKDIKRLGEKNYSRSYDSALDIGAGNGKVLKALRERAGIRSLHAIEKSMILCEQLDPDILIVGTDFAEQSLLSKHVDVVFCNPPYSAFEAWSEKIIRQAASSVVYLVIPQRWEKSIPIADAIKYRDAECKVIGQFDFEDAEDRRASAKVHLLRVTLQRERHSKENDDAFERFFKETFAHLIDKFSNDGDQAREDGEKNSRFSSLVVGPTYVESMVALYDAECAKVQNNFNLVAQLDVALLKEFSINPPTVMKCLKERLAGLRSLYWSELFSNLHKVTDRLTSDSRRALLDTLHQHVHVDFTQSNIYAVLIWVIKNSNIYIESQLIKTYALMVDKCNVRLYASNKRTWEDERWRYKGEESKNTHFALDYRIVTHRIGGIRCGYSFERGLDERAAHFLGDLLTIARNMGFECDTAPNPLNNIGRKDWESGVVHEFCGLDRRTRKSIVLVEARAFKNGNVHLRLAKSFILALNVEHGRLKGWLHTRDQAVEELRDEEAGDYFHTNALLGSNPALLLGYAGAQAQAA